MTTKPDYTVDQTSLSLVDSVYRRTLTPTAANTLVRADIIELLSEELKSTVVPLILAAQEEYYVQNYDQALVSGTYSYTIPTRAAFATWRDVVFVDSIGNELPLSELTPEYIKLGYPIAGAGPLSVFGFLIVNDKIQLWPSTITVPTQYSLRMKIKRRPNSLTGYANCGQITAINTGTKQVTLTAAGDGSWTTATTFDIIPNSPQFTSRGDDQTMSAVVSNIITFTALPTGMIVGDWVCPAGLSCVPQIPYDMFPLLAQRGVIKTCEAYGDGEALQVAERRYQDMAVDFARTVSPRVEGAQKKLVNRSNSQFYGNFIGNFSR